MSEVHFETYDGVHCRIENGSAMLSNDLHPVSHLQIYNPLRKQTVVIGGQWDDHAQAVEGDLRAVMIHVDDDTGYRKVVVAEPKEFTLGVVVPDPNAGPQDVEAVAILRIDDEMRNMSLLNHFSPAVNQIEIGEHATTLSYHDATGQEQRKLVFDKGGLRMYFGGQLVWGIQPDGSEY